MTCSRQFGSCFVAVQSANQRSGKQNRVWHHPVILVRPRCQRSDRAGISIAQIPFRGRSLRDSLSYCHQFGYWPATRILPSVITRVVAVVSGTSNPRNGQSVITTVQPEISNDVGFHGNSHPCEKADAQSSFSRSDIPLVHKRTQPLRNVERFRNGWRSITGRAGLGQCYRNTLYGSQLIARA